MSKEIETGTQRLDDSSDAIELRIRQEPEMETQGTEASVDGLTLRSVDQRIKQMTDPIFRRVDELCALLAGRTEMEFAENCEATGSRLIMSLLAPHVTSTTPGASDSLCWVYPWINIASKWQKILFLMKFVCCVDRQRCWSCFFCWFYFIGTFGGTIMFACY